MAFNRAELELIASAVNVNASTFANDSKLEQKILYELRTMTAKVGTGTTTAPSPFYVNRVSGAANA